jgi:hypothetical protein
MPMVLGIGKKRENDLIKDFFGAEHTIDDNRQ